MVLLAYAVPGPDFLVLIRASARRRFLGRAAAFGAQAGLCVHIAATVLGFSLLVSGSALAFTVIKLAGAAYPGQGGANRSPCTRHRQGEALAERF